MKDSDIPIIAPPAEPTFEGLTQKRADMVIVAWREVDADGNPIAGAMPKDFMGQSATDKMLGNPNLAPFNFPIGNVKSFAEAFVAFADAKSLHIRVVNTQIQMQYDEMNRRQLAEERRAEIAKAARGIPLHR